MTGMLLHIQWIIHITGKTYIIPIISNVVKVRQKLPNNDIYLWIKAFSNKVEINITLS